MEEPEPETAALLPLASIEFKILPQPDILVGTLEAGESWLVISDGSTLAAKVMAGLLARNIRLAVLGSSGTSHANLVYQADLPNGDPEAFAHKLSSAKQALGKVDGLVFFQPQMPNGEMFPEAGRTSIEMAFLTARAVQPDLVLGRETGRSSFVTVSRLDGALGLSGSSTTGAIDAGMAGLVRTLSQEWPDVYCRAVDLSPEIEEAIAARAVMVELEDADVAIIEVGITKDGRQTPVIAAYRMEQTNA